MQKKARDARAFLCQAQDCSAYRVEFGQGARLVKSQVGRGHRAQLVATRSPLLNRRAFHVAIRTINATISRERSKHSPAPLAVVIELTRVRRHQILRFMPTFGTGYRRVRLDWRQLWGHRLSVTIAGKPTSMDDCRMSFDSEFTAISL